MEGKSVTLVEFSTPMGSRVKLYLAASQPPARSTGLQHGRPAKRARRGVSLPYVFEAIIIIIKRKGEVKTGGKMGEKRQD